MATCSLEGPTVVRLVPQRGCVHWRAEAHLGARRQEHTDPFHAPAFCRLLPRAVWRTGIPLLPPDRRAQAVGEAQLTSTGTMWDSVLQTFSDVASTFSTWTIVDNMCGQCTGLRWEWRVGKVAEGCHLAFYFPNVQVRSSPRSRQNQSTANY